MTPFLGPLMMGVKKRDLGSGPKAYKGGNSHIQALLCSRTNTGI